jgi:hypothetical protein
VQAIILILLFFAVRAQAGTKEAARVVIVVPANVLQNWPFHFVTHVATVRGSGLHGMLAENDMKFKVVCFVRFLPGMITFEGRSGVLDRYGERVFSIPCSLRTLCAL